MAPSTRSILACCSRTGARASSASGPRVHCSSPAGIGRLGVGRVEHILSLRSGSAAHSLWRDRRFGTLDRYVRSTAAPVESRVLAGPWRQVADLDTATDDGPGQPTRGRRHSPRRAENRRRSRGSTIHLGCRPPLPALPAPPKGLPGVISSSPKAARPGLPRHSAPRSGGAAFGLARLFGLLLYGDAIHFVRVDPSRASRPPPWRGRIDGRSVLGRCRAAPPGGCDPDRRSRSRLRRQRGAKKRVAGVVAGRGSGDPAGGAPGVGRAARRGHVGVA